MLPRRARHVEAVIAALGKYRYDKDLFYEMRDRDPAQDGRRRARGALHLPQPHVLQRPLARQLQGQVQRALRALHEPQICDPDALRAASRALAEVTIAHGRLQRGHARSPTLATSSTSTRRTSPPPRPPISRATPRAASAPSDQARLVAEMERLRTRGVFAVLSNADTPRTRALYKGFKNDSVEAPRPINSNATKRGPATELVVTTGAEARRKKTRAAGGAHVTDDERDVPPPGYSSCARRSSSASASAACATRRPRALRRAQRAHRREAHRASTR